MSPLKQNVQTDENGGYKPSNRSMQLPLAGKILRNQQDRSIQNSSQNLIHPDLPMPNNLTGNLTSTLEPSVMNQPNAQPNILVLSQYENQAR